MRDEHGSPGGVRPVESFSHRQARLKSDLEHLRLERDLLAGQAVHWEWQARLALADVERWKAASDGASITSQPSLAEAAPTSSRRTSAAAGARRVAFISDGSEGPRRYRADHQAEALALGGWSADVTVYQDVFGSLTHLIETYDAFVLQRLPLRPGLEWFMQQARERAKPLLYDIDDLIFDPLNARHCEQGQSISTDERRLTEHGMWRIGQTLLRCDAVIASTEPLGALAQPLHSRVYVSRNAVSQAMQASADAVLRGRTAWRAGDAVTLAYLSGTPSHNRDFEQATGAVRWALETYPSTRLLVVGPLELPAELRAFGRRVQRLSLQPWQALPGLIAEVSINLGPLESNNPFTAAKSCIKYLEAGLLGVPTVASPRHDFASVIRDGDNGRLAESADDWRSALSALIGSASMREGMGCRAREDVLERHTTAARGDRLRQLIGELCDELSGGRGSA